MHTGAVAISPQDWGIMRRNKCKAIKIHMFSILVKF